MRHWGDWLIYLSQFNALNLAELSRVFKRSNIKSAANFSSFNLTSFFALMLAACSGGGGGGGAPTPPQGGARGTGARGVVRSDDIIGTPGDDVLVGTERPNKIWGRAGNDSLEGKAGADRLDGEAGLDVASYESSKAGVSVTVNATTGNTGGDAAGDQLYNIEGLRGSAFADRLTGDDKDNGLQGGGGPDILDGKDGTDLASYLFSPAGVSVTVNATSGNQGGDATGDQLYHIEGLVGSAFADTLTGDAGDNALFGQAGNDILIGGAGADRLNGGTGKDTLTGGAENDIFVLGASVATRPTADIITDFIRGDKITLPESTKAVYYQILGRDIWLVTTGATLRFYGKLQGFTDTLSAADFTNQGLFVARLVLGTPQDDNLAGSDHREVIRGLAGTDTLSYSQLKIRDNRHHQCHLWQCRRGCGRGSFI